MSKREEYERKTQELVMPILEEKGFELYDIEYVKEGSNWYLRVYIDKPEGITSNDCADVSREMNVLLDEKDFIPDSYIFEVSSPGLGRVLKKEKHLEKSLGEVVELHTYKPIQHEKQFEGILKAFDDKTITIQLEDETEMVFERQDVSLIRLALDF